MIKVYFLFLVKNYVIINNTEKRVEDSIVVSKGKTQSQSIENALNKLEKKEGVSIISFSECTPKAKVIFGKK